MSYALFEVALIWAAFLLLWTVVRRVRPLHLLPPVLLLLAFGYLLAIKWYAPAYFDADAFLQRWVVEEAAPYLIWLAGVLVPVTACSLLGLLAVGLLRLARRGRPPGRRQRLAASWAPAVLLALAIAGLHGLAWVQDTRTLRTLTAALDPQDTAWLDEARALRTRIGLGERLSPEQLPPNLRALAERTLAVVPAPAGSNDVHAYVLLGIGGGECLFLWRSPAFTYLDFRALDAHTGEDGVRTMLATRRPVAAGSLGERFTGAPVLRPDGTIAALAYVRRTMGLSL